MKKQYAVGVPFVILLFLLSPLVILAPVAFIGCLAVGIDPLEAGRLLWRVSPHCAARTWRSPSGIARCWYTFPEEP